LVTLKFIMKKECDENNGRFYMAVTPDRGTKEVLFDLTKLTHHPNEKCPDGFRHFQPLIQYTLDEIINFQKTIIKN